MRAMRWAERADAGERARARASDTVCTARRRIAPGDYVELCGEDEGHGIPLDIVDRIFEPFFTTKEVGKAAAWGSPVCTASCTSSADTSCGRPRGQSVRDFACWSGARSEHGRNGIRRRHTTAFCRSALTGHVLVVDDEQT